MDNLKFVRLALEQAEQGNLIEPEARRLLFALFSPASLVRLLRLPLDRSAMNEHAKDIEAVCNLLSKNTVTESPASRRGPLLSNHPLRDILNKWVFDVYWRSSGECERSLEPLQKAFELALCAMNEALTRGDASRAEATTALALSAAEWNLLETLRVSGCQDLPGRVSSVRVVNVQRSKGGPGRLSVEWFPSNDPWTLIPHPDVFPLIRDGAFESSLELACACVKGWAKQQKISLCGQGRWNLRWDRATDLYAIRGESMGLAVAVAIIQAIDATLPANSEIVLTSCVAAEGSTGTVDNVIEKLEAAFDRNTFPLVHAAIISGLEEISPYPNDLDLQRKVYKVPNIETALGVIRQAEQRRQAVREIATSDFTNVPVLIGARAGMAQLFVPPACRQEMPETSSSETTRRGEADPLGQQSAPEAAQEIRQWEEPGIQVEPSLSHELSWEEFLKKMANGHKGQNAIGTRFAILAPPGGGKSVLLRGIAVEAAKQSDSFGLPGYIYLPSLLHFLGERWKQEGRDAAIDGIPPDAVAEYLAQRFTKAKFADSMELPQSEWVRQWKIWLQAGSVLLLLDGLDEVTRNHAILQKMLAFYQQCPVIVACRTAARDSLSMIGFSSSHASSFTFVLSPLNYERQDNFIAAYLADESQDTWDRLKVELDRKPQIERLARNPMLLSLICYFVHENLAGELPETRTELYLSVTRHMLEQFAKNSKAIATSVSQHYIDVERELHWRLLEALAIEVEPASGGTGETLWLARPQVKALFEAEIRRSLPAEKEPDRRAEQIMTDFRTHLRLLNAFNEDENTFASEERRPGGEVRFRLIHRTFEEFFAASSLRRRIAQQSVKPVLPLLNVLFSLPHYREILAFLSGLLAADGHTNELAFLLKRGLEGDEEDTFRGRLAMANWCLGQIPNRIWEQKKKEYEAVQRIGQTILSSDLSSILVWVDTRLRFLLEHGDHWHIQTNVLGNALPEVGSRILNVAVPTGEANIDTFLQMVGLSPPEQHLQPLLPEVGSQLLNVAVPTGETAVDFFLDAVGLDSNEQYIQTFQSLILHHLPKLCRSPYAVPPEYLIAARKGFEEEYSQALNRGGHEHWCWFRASFQAEFILVLLTNVGIHPIWDSIMDIVDQCLKKQQWNYVLDRLLTLGLRSANRIQAKKWQYLVSELHDQAIFDRSMCVVDALQGLTPRQRHEVINVDAAITATTADAEFWASDPDPSETWPHVPAHVFQLKAILDARIELSEEQCHHLTNFLLEARRIDQAAHFLYMLTESPKQSRLIQSHMVHDKVREWFESLSSHPHEMVAFWCGYAAVCLLRLSPSGNSASNLEDLLTGVIQGRIHLPSREAECSLIHHLGELWNAPQEQHIRFIFDELFDHLQAQETVTYLDSLKNVLMKLLPKMDEAAVAFCRREVIRRTRAAVKDVMEYARQERDEETLWEDTAISEFLLCEYLGLDPDKTNTNEIIARMESANYRFTLASLLHLRGYDFSEGLDFEEKRARGNGIFSRSGQNNGEGFRDKQQAYKQQKRVAKFGLNLLAQGAYFFAVPETVGLVRDWLDTYGNEKMLDQLSWSPLEFLAGWQRYPLTLETSRELLRLLNEQTGFPKRVCALALSGTSSMLESTAVREVLESDFRKCLPAYLKQRANEKGTRLSRINVLGEASRHRTLQYNVWHTAFKERVRVRRSDYSIRYTSDLEEQAKCMWRELPDWKLHKREVSYGGLWGRLRNWITRGKSSEI